MKNKKIKLLGLLLFLTMALTGCGESAKTDEEKIVETLSNGYPETVQISQLVQPKAIINAFNYDFDRAVELYNDKLIGFKISASELQQGNLIVPTENANENTERESLYIQYIEDDGDGKNNNNEEMSDKTTLVATIRDEDNYLVPYIINEEAGTGLISEFFVLGKISSVVGDTKYNLFMYDCQMVPVNPIAPVDVLPTESSVKSVLDTVSSEKIDLNTTLYKEGTTDFNKDGTADVLTVATTNTTPLSSFDKLIYNGIVKKISVNLASQATIMIDNFETPFNVLLPYPEQIKEVIFKPVAGIDGNPCSLIDINCLGQDKKDILYEENKEIFNEMIPALKENAIAIESKHVLCTASSNGPSNITFKLVDGTEVSSIDNNRVFIKSFEITDYGKITGEIYVKALKPFEHYYQTSFQLLSNSTAEEVPLDTHEFYESELFENTDEFNYSEDGQKLKHEFVVSTEPKIFTSYTESDKNNSNSIAKNGTGITSDGECKVLIIPTGEYISFQGIELSEDGQNSFIRGTYDKKSVYIPIDKAELITSSDNIQVLGTTYKLKDLFFL